MCFQIPNQVRVCIVPVKSFRFIALQNELASPKQLKRSSMKYLHFASSDPPQTLRPRPLARGILVARLHNSLIIKDLLIAAEGDCVRKEGLRAANRISLERMAAMPAREKASVATFEVFARRANLKAWTPHGHGVSSGKQVQVTSKT